MAGPAALIFLAVVAPAMTARAQLSTPRAPQLSKPSGVQLEKIPAAVPTITSVAPTGCVTIGAEVKLTGVNFGASKPAGLSLALQPQSGTHKVVAASTWSATIVKFLVPSTAGLTAGSPFTAGIHNGSAFVTSVPMSLCAPAAGKASTGAIQASGAAQQAPSTIVKQPAVSSPKITSVTPLTCVRTGQEVKFGGSNFGSPKPAGFAIAVQAAGEGPKTVAEHSWTSTSITFSLPAGLPPGSLFTAGILSGGAFVASAKLTACAVAGDFAKRATPASMTKKFPSQLTKPHIPIDMGSGQGSQQGTGGSPEITSVSPTDCVNVGSAATAEGVNLGASKADAGLSLGIQVYDAPPTIEVVTSSWSPTSIGFIVPPEAGQADWFTLGIIYQSIFYPQFYVWNCSAYAGQGGGYDSYDTSAYEDEVQGSGVAGPKGARRLGPGGVDVQIPPAPSPEEAAAGQPPQTGRRAVGGKLLAMKALSRLGLHKLNKECDVQDPHCPCCRKDDSVCLEKEADGEDGSSTWVVRWKKGAKTFEGRDLYSPRRAENDVEAVTGLQCEPIGDAVEGSGVATLTCR